jgi:hypothetical protein
MDLRRLLRPLPMVVIAAFAAVAVIDVLLATSTPPSEPPVLLEDGRVTFHAAEPQFDFRAPREPQFGVERPILEPGGWSQARKQGAWMRGRQAGFEVELPRDDFRALALECRRAGAADQRRVVLSVNGVDCGELPVDARWSVCTLPLEMVPLSVGRNRIQLRVADAPTVSDRRQVLVRSAGFFLEPGDVPERLDASPPVAIDTAGSGVTIRRSGALRILFTMHERVDALIVDYRLGSEDARAEFLVKRVPAEPLAVVPQVRYPVSARDQPRGRVRVPLHGRRGDFSFEVEAELGPSNAPLDLKSLELVNEDR